MFGRDPGLLIDQLVRPGEPQDYQLHSWVTRHQKELRDAHRRVAHRLAREAEVHKRKHVKHLRSKLSPVQVGQQVLVRDRTIPGQNKTPDEWVAEQLDNGIYVIEPADGHGGTRLVNRAEL